MISTTIRSSIIRTARVSPTSRAFSCQAAEKIKCVFEEYRRQNFSRETRSRFRKELIKAAETESSCTKGAVEVDALNTILVNIGRPQDRLTEKELNDILAEAGCVDDRAIPVDKMLQLM